MRFWADRRKIASRFLQISELANYLYNLMNMKKSNVFSTLITLLAVFQLQAQMVTVMTPDMTVDQGSNVQVDVKVEDFESIIGMQFAVFWDESVLEFVGINNFNLPGTTVADNFNLMNVQEGKFRFNWVDPDPFFSGVSLDDNASMFSIYFKAIGGPSSSTLLEVTGDTTHPVFPIEFSDVDGIIEVKLDPGTITIAGPNATEETITSDFTLFQNNPNPFNDLTNISFFINETTQAQLSIYDHSGKLVFQQKDRFMRGSHTIQINRNLFQSAGSYFYTLKTEHATATRQMVVN